MKRCILSRGVWSPALVMVLAVTAASASPTRPADTNVATGEEWIAEEMRELRHRFADDPAALPEARRAWFEKNREWLERHQEAAVEEERGRVRPLPPDFPRESEGLSVSEREEFETFRQLWRERHEILLRFANEPEEARRDLREWADRAMAWQKISGAARATHRNSAAEKELREILEASKKNYLLMKDGTEEGSPAREAAMDVWQAEHRAALLDFHRRHSVSTDHQPW